MTYVVNIALALATNTKLVPAHVSTLPPVLLRIDIGTLRVVVEHHKAVRLVDPRSMGRADMVAVDSVQVEVRRSKVDECDQGAQEVRHR